MTHSLRIEKYNALNGSLNEVAQETIAYLRYLTINNRLLDRNNSDTQFDEFPFKKDFFNFDVIKEYKKAEKEIEKPGLT